MIAGRDMTGRSKCGTGSGGQGREGGRIFSLVRNRFAQSCLVTPGGGFYNPSNTALEAVESISVPSALNRPVVRLLLPRASAYVFTPLFGTPRSTE